MKTTFCGICIVLLGFSLYFVQKDFGGFKNPSTPQQSLPNNEKSVTVAQESAKKKCKCCDRKVSAAKEKANQRQQERETWARQMITDYGYEEGMERITAKSPWLAKQIQRILDREKRLKQTPAVSESDT